MGVGSLYEGLMGISSPMGEDKGLTAVERLVGEDKGLMGIVRLSARYRGSMGIEETMHVLRATTMRLTKFQGMLLK